MHCQDYHQLKSSSIIFSVTDSPISTGRSTAGSTTMLMTFASNPGVSVALIKPVIGGVAGALFVLAFLLLLLALVWMTKIKCKRAMRETQYNLDHQQPQSEIIEQRETIQHAQEKHQEDEAMNMKSNDTYISTTHQISTEINVAYGQIESDHILLSEQCEHDYI